MSQQFKLNHYAQLSQVQSEIRKIQKDPKGFYHTLEAAEPYIYYILQQTRQRGLPTELALLPVIESAYNPYDRETTGATGLWQLMPQTASDLGVKVNHSYDGRMNVIDSTKAALTYLSYLGNHFRGNWSLALAAYNWGPGNIDSAERRSGSKSFWQLHMPQETTRYVPKLLAVAEVVEHPAKYGLQLPPVTNKPYFAEVQVNKPINLPQAAKSAGVSVKTLVHLNSAYQQPTTPIANKNILVPLSKAQTIQNNLVATGIVKPKTNLLAMNNPTPDPSYVVQAGDDLEQIAKQFHVDVQSIINANNLKDRKVYPGQKLIIPAEGEHLA
jgi:membrane-bound lytic murein transglycosylase D